MSDRQVAAVLLSARAKGVEMPTLEAKRQRLDEALIEAPTVVDRDRQELLEALGVR